MSTLNDAAASLLSLSIAATQDIDCPQIQPSTSVGTTHKTHRRLASTGKTRRRLSDAREAASRPSPAILHASPPALSLASLSLSSSPPSNTIQVSTSLTTASKALGTQAHQPGPLNDGSNIPHSTDTTPNAKPIPIANPNGNGNGNPNGTGKKRGVEHKCESCSKIYRHPSCLIKHRWEHTPHWREASKFVLSKHQQVQLLEAAAILSHLSPTSSSLPDDRSLWPSFLSGGSLPPPDPSTLMSTSDSKKSSNSTSAAITSPSVSLGTAVSSSVPANTGYTRYSRASSTGPRMHDYSIPVGPTAAAANTVTVTQLRPGLLGVPTTNSYTNGHSSSNTDTAVDVPVMPPAGVSQSWSSVPARGEEGLGTGVWSLPRSSVRSISGSSRSRSGSASDDELLLDGVSAENENDENESAEEEESSYGRRYRNGVARRAHTMYTYSSARKAQRSSGGGVWKREEDELSVNVGRGWSLREEDEYSGDKRAVKGKEEWDGMEMEMDMD
ncbi:hypothetical protein P691DRAFT_797603 [Macrolepiota fuliginosa MF-IS2]|uniref:C2H2-type domain-containing protein n=1 Tax=Macrolepiota fuliginosa MF-IS2 TaxID=1400762 RepID=A0A9P5XIA0_9AGAR|nr:hypothetical protein P691DRAFT_797603 [Macrolepiota fuliginosa MF-IS2]